MGGATTVELAAAASEAGALGFLASAYLTPEQIQEESRRLKTRTERPFGNNLFVPQPIPGAPVNPAAALGQLAFFHSEVDLPEPTLPKFTSEHFDEKLAAVLEGGAPVFSFTFGVLPAEAMRVLQDRRIYVYGTATTVDEGWNWNAREWMPSLRRAVRRARIAEHSEGPLKPR